ncbi:MAG: hypothetical protein O6943_03230 [Bacteroidetes bacterium]|nr:hypothetical protein [Bacteroidota bacterium]
MSIIANFGLNTTIFKVYHAGIIKFIELVELRRIMKQVLISKGNVFVDEVPTPIVTDDTILVKTGFSLISTGTEISGITKSGGSVIKKTMKQPDKVKFFLIKKRTKVL